MYDDREDMMNDVAIDEAQNRYEVTITVSFKKRVYARTQDDAENMLYDDIKGALKGSHLDYDFEEFDTEEIADERVFW